MKISVKPLIKRVRALATLNNGVLVVAILIASTWVWSTIEAIQHNFKLQQQVDALSQKIAVDELQNKTLQLQKTYYNSDQYLELSARERLGLAMPGEKVLILPANTVKPLDQTAAQTTSSGETISDRSNFAQWMYFLFGKKGQ
jgi:cell division protein FtsB